MPSGIDKRYLVELKGKLHPTWIGILDAAHEAGLLSLETTILAFPSESNKWTAVAEAKATFKDGRCFSDIGDANAENVGNPHIAKHIIRMASTRAKGRALRDALNIGDALAEEMAEEIDQMAAARSGGSRAARTSAPPTADAEERPPSIEERWQLGKATCGWKGCVGRLLTADEIRGCQDRNWPPLCQEHGKEHLKKLNAARPS